MAATTTILLLLGDARRAARLRETLQRVGSQVVTLEQLWETDSVCDVLVSDSLAWPPRPPRFHEKLRRGEIGVVLLGLPAGGDVVLPSDATDREIALACRLIAEVTRLRRQLRRQRGQSQQLHRLAHIDPLTRLANRRSWDLELALRFANAQSGDLLTLAIFDLDGFKVVNDTLGHPAADRVLAAAAAALRSHVRPDDFCARLGGDEFGMLVSGLTPPQARKLVERLRRQIGAAATRQLDQHFTVSAGLAQAPTQGGNAAALYEAADAALRRAKHEGRNRLCEDGVVSAD